MKSILQHELQKYYHGQGTDLSAWTNIAKGDEGKKQYEREEMLSPHKIFLKKCERLFPSKSDREAKGDEGEKIREGRNVLTS